MKKNLRTLAYIAIIVAGLIILLNIDVTTRQGVDFEVHMIKIPLYLKVLDFFDRHYNYAELVKRILKGAKDDKERVMKLFEWTHKNIRKAPEGYPIIDDHAWHIIVRGYGVNDQSSDVFTTLCNYAGIDAFFSTVYAKDQTAGAIFSFVKLDKRWRVFDSYNGAYFLNRDGEIASIKEINSGNWQLKILGEHIQKTADDYEKCFANLPTIKDIGLQRANIQSPLRRLIYEIKKRL